jgi:general secretion pathway protein K
MADKRMATIGRQRGFALVVVLWVLALLGIIAASFLRDNRAEVRVTYNLLENAKAEAVADAGVQRAMLGLLDQDEATAWRADGTPYAFALGEGDASIRMWNEAGKIDLNNASEEVLKGLLMAVGMKQDEAARVVDVVTDFRRPGSARSSFGGQSADDTATGPRVGPFEAAEELMRVPGITAELYERLSPAITVYGRSQVDVTAAPPLVLQVLRAVMPDRLDRLIAARQANIGQLSRPRTVTVTVIARTAGGGLFVREAIIQRAAGPQPFRVLAWRQRWSESAAGQ